MKEVEEKANIIVSYEAIASGQSHLRIGVAPDLALVMAHCSVQFAQLTIRLLLVISSRSRISAVPLHDH